MRRVGFLLLSLAASLLMLGQALCADSADLFFQAYQDFQTAEKMERENRPQEALDKYFSASKVLEKIASEQPDWQPVVLQYRLKKTKENIARLEPQLANRPPQPTENPEGPLPEVDRTAPLPEISSQPLRRSNPIEEVETPRSTGGSDIRELRKENGKLRREIQQLNERILTRTGELQGARATVDKTMVSVVELKAQLAQATDALSDLQRDQSSAGSQQKDFTSRLNQMTLQLAEVEADKEVLMDENERLWGKLDLASKYIEGSDTIRQGLLKDRDTLIASKDAIAAKTKRIKDNTAEIEKVTAENKQLKTKLAEFEKSQAGQAELEKLATENKALNEKLAEAERNSVSKAELQKLAEEKASVETKFAEAEKQLKEALDATPEKDKLVTALQSELNGVKDRLLEAQSQMSRGEEQIRDLQKQLDETSGELAKMKINGTTGRDQNNLAAENEVLRGIILRQIKEQAHRDEAKKNLEKEISALQIKSDVINQQLAVLTAPVLQLTPEERSLFKEPIAVLEEPYDESLSASMVAVKPGENGGAAATQGADALPQNIREQIDQAGKLFSTKEYAEAEKLYQPIVEQFPNNYFALANLGAVQIEAGKLSAAEVALKRAIEINPKYGFAYTNLGIAHSRQGKFDEAISDLKQAITLNDGDWKAHNYLGICLGQKNSPVEAEKELKRAVELNESYPDAHFNLAVLYATLEPPALELAKKHYEKATQLGAPPDRSLERLIQ